MNKSILSTGVRWLWLALLVFIVDGLTKFWILSNFKLYESIQLLPFFNLTYVRNYGAAFSILVGQRWILSIVAAIIIPVFIVMMYRSLAKIYLTNIAFSLIIGGAIGNLFDRLYHGFVVDFLHVYINNWHYPIFNFADVAVCLGAAFIILGSVIDSFNERTQANGKTNK